MQIDLGSTKNAKNPNNRNPQTLTLKTPKSNQEKNTRARVRGSGLPSSATAARRHAVQKRPPLVGA